MRGYGTSTRLSPDEIACRVKPSELHRTHIDDFIEFLNFVVNDLKVPTSSSDGTEGITVLFWSKGGPLALGLYYFGTPESAALLGKAVSSIIFFEPPNSAVLGQPHDATAVAILQTAISQEDPATRFMKYASGFFKNPPKFLADMGGEQVLDYYRSGALEPEFQKIALKASEKNDMPSTLLWSLADEEDTRQVAAREALQKIATSSLKRVGTIWGSEGPPASLLGCWQIEKSLVEFGANDKVRTRQVEGGNHFIHYYMPEQFWGAVLELSV